MIRSNDGKILEVKEPIVLSPEGETLYNPELSHEVDASRVSVFGGLSFLVSVALGIVAITTLFVIGSAFSLVLAFFLIWFWVRALLHRR